MGPFFIKTMKLTSYYILISSLILLICKFSYSADTRLEILYISNVNAVVKNCYCGDPSLGGLARIATVLQEKRKNNPDLIYIDGGDLLNTYSYPALNKAVSEIYHKIQPNILCVGDQEFSEGTSFLFNASGLFKHFILASNMKMKDMYLNTDLNIEFISKDRTFKILSFLDKSAFDIIKKPERLILTQINFNKHYEDTDSGQVLIVNFHGSNQALQKFIKIYRNIDIVLWAHGQSDKTDLANKPVIIGGGTDSQYLKNINVQIIDNQPLVKFKDIPIGLTIEPDTEILEIIKKWGIH